MTKVTAQMSVSLDGYYAGPRSTTDPHDMAAWLEGPEGPGFFRVTRWVIDAMAWRERQGVSRGGQAGHTPGVEGTFAPPRAPRIGPALFDRGGDPGGGVSPVPGPRFAASPPAP